MANTLNLFRIGAVGLFVWLDRSQATTHENSLIYNLPISHRYVEGHKRERASRLGRCYRSGIVTGSHPSDDTAIGLAGVIRDLSMCTLADEPTDVLRFSKEQYRGTRILFIGAALLSGYVFSARHRNK